MNKAPNQYRPAPPPPFTAAVIASLAAVAAFAFLRLYLYPDRSVPLTYALPLLLGVWHKDRVLHWVLAAGLAIVAGVQIVLILPDEHALVARPVSYAMMLANIGIVGAVVDRLIVAHSRLRQSYVALEDSNDELSASNEELAAREEEISSQNEELQAQAEELEHQNEELLQQSEELQQQSEEMQQQTEELQHLNEESVNRQRVLQALLEASTMTTADAGMSETAERICEAALEATGSATTGAIVLSRQDDELVVLASSGVEMPEAGAQAPLVFNDPLAATVMHERRIAAIEDLATTPEVKPPRGRDGTTFRAALAAPILDGATAVGAIVLYAHDVRRWSRSEFQIAEWLAAQSGLVLLSARLQQELDRRRVEAEDASQRKTRFLAAVSHDVRTPANAISLTAEVIKRAGENPDVAHEIPELAEALRSNAKLLVELVSDVLDLARFDSGKVEVEPSDFCLQDMVAKEIMQYQALAKSAGLSLDGTTEAGTIWLRTDRMKLARVLSNLIGNALKFTDRGGVEVRCTQSAEGLVEVHVEDTGVGIQPTHLEHIFDEFYQIKNPERDRSKGTGLGLAICKRLVDAIGCALTVRSHYGQGTTFSIRIPPELVIADPSRDGSAAPQQCQQQPQRPAKRLAGVRLLLVEDHETTRIAFSRLLADQGAEVETAADGREALRVLGHHAPDVVLLDLMLPDMDGREVLRRLALNRPAAMRCVLAVTGDLTDERRREVESLGADGIVGKPLVIGDLVERICSELKHAADHTQPNGEFVTRPLAGPPRGPRA